MTSIKGVIFDIKEFAVFDGPGLRQTVFLKGCPLRCTWCHNPEGLKKEPQLMVSKASCNNCGNCKSVCNHDTCIECGGCVSACPLNLRKIVGEEITSEELVARIRENSDYYDRYGGGVTFSGGEPLFQTDFLLGVLKEIEDIHSAIETSGYCKTDRFKEVISYLDLVMMDIKIMDSVKHKEYTGVDNKLILENAQILCEGNIPFIIRMPIIPGVNDNEDNYRETAKLISSSESLIKVELLPYHQTAGAKYGMIGEIGRASCRERV